MRHPANKRFPKHPESTPNLKHPQNIPERTPSRTKQNPKPVLETKVGPGAQGRITLRRNYLDAGAAQVFFFCNVIIDEIVDWLVHCISFSNQLVALFYLLRFVIISVPKPTIHLMAVSTHAGSEAQKSLEEWTK